MRNQERSPITAVLIVLSFAVAGVMTVAMGQEGPFGQASLRGTYSWITVNAGADQPVPNYMFGGFIHYDGEGNHRVVSMIANVAGEPDAEGNPTRTTQRVVTDPGTWRFDAGTYEVLPSGAFVWSWPNGDGDALVRRAEEIDGTMTIMEYVLVFRNVPATGGVVMFEHVRIADGDILPTPQEEAGAGEAAEEE